MEFMLAKWEEQARRTREWKQRQLATRDNVILKGLLAGRYENCFATENLLFSSRESSVEYYETCGQAKLNFVQN